MIIPDAGYRQAVLEEEPISYFNKEKSNMGMKVFFALFLLLLGMKTGEVIAAEEPEVYRLHPGDSVQVSVWKEDSLLKEVMVLPDGSITLPLAGRVEVAGLSTPEAERLIITKLKPYLPDPVVTVVITGIGGNGAYVLGKVVHPGTLKIDGPLTVLQAISMVGGFDKFADESGIKVIRSKPDGQLILPVHYKDIISGKDMSTNIQLKAGDTIVVP